MSEHQAELAHTAMAATAIVAKPRISADAFRNLTARLKKTEIAIPDLMPQPYAAPVVMPAPDVVLEAAVDLPEPAVAQSVEAVLPAVVAEPEPFVPPAVAMDVPPQRASIEAHRPIPEAWVSPAFEPLQPFQVQPQPELAEPVETEVVATEITPEFLAEPVLVVAEPVAISTEQPAAEAEQFMVAAEPQLEGSFADNFTYVPEGGPSASAELADEEPAKADLSGIDEAVKREVAERSTQLALENNWRLLLAKPTAEDRTIYLREAAEYHEFDEEWNKPAPEHDLSRIEPAVDLGIEIEACDAAQAPGALQRSLQDTLPVAEGQDLAELTRSLLDMMAAGNASGLPQERALAADTLLRLVPRLELKPLVMLAQRLSIMDNPPHLLAARLIRDPRVEVAGPLLEDCAHLTDRDLETVVQEGEAAKLRMIARRRKLTRPITDALIKSGDPSVVLTLVRNMEAEISHDGFQSLLVLCENNEELLAPLATRHDMQAPFAFELFWMAPAQLRRFILSRFLTDSETLTKILKITMATQSEDETEAEPLNQHALLEALERAARGQVEIASDELAGIMQLSPATVQRILGDLQGDAMVVMLKAAGYPRSAMPGLLKRMQDADLPLISRERDINELQSMFETLSFNKARILLTYWDWCQGKTGPYAPVQ